MISIHAPGLDLSVEEAVRQLALQRLEEARSALVDGNTDSGSEPGRLEGERMDGFGGALGGLQRLLQTYGESALETPCLDVVLRRLNHISDATGTVRDAHAQLDWLRLHLGPQSDCLDMAGRELERILQARRSYGYACTREKAVPEFLALQSDLHALLGEPRVRTAVATPARESFARVTGRQLADAAQRLEGELKNEDLLQADPGAERLRASAVQLRSLLEPLARRLPRAREALEGLRELQGLLAELEQLQGLRSLVSSTLDRAAFERARARIAAAEAGDVEAERQARRALLEDGCVAVAAAIQVRRRAVFGILAQDWIGGAGAVFFAALGALADDLQREEPAIAIAQRSAERTARRDASEARLEEAFTRLVAASGADAGTGKRRRGVSALQALREFDESAGRVAAAPDERAEPSADPEHGAAALPVAALRAIETAAATPVAAAVAAQTAAVQRRARVPAFDPKQIGAQLLERAARSSGLLPSQLVPVASSLAAALFVGAVLGGLAVGSVAGPAVPAHTAAAEQSVPALRDTAQLERPAPDAWFSAFAVRDRPSVSAAPRLASGGDGSD